MSPRGSAPHAVPGGTTSPASKTPVVPGTPDSEIETVEGELVPEPVSEAEAKRQDRLLRESVLNNLGAVERTWERIEQAGRDQVHVSLGYASFVAYLNDVYGDQPIHLPREARPTVCGWLAAEGMSGRMIADRIGVSEPTARRALTQAGASHDAPDVSDTVSITKDGKSYPRRSNQDSEPKKPREKSITKSFDSAEYKLRAAIQTVENLAKSDRLRPNREALTDTVTRVQELSDRLGTAVDSIGSTMTPPTDVAAPARWQHKNSPTEMFETIVAAFCNNATILQSVPLDQVVIADPAKLHTDLEAVVDSLIALNMHVRRNAA